MAKSAPSKIAFPDRCMVPQPNPCFNSLADLSIDRRYGAPCDAVVRVSRGLQLTQMLTFSGRKGLKNLINAVETVNVLGNQWIDSLRPVVNSQ
jgi:hypothetical protein